MMSLARVGTETSACQLASPGKTCPTKILEQLTTPAELFKFIVGKENSAEHTFDVVLEDKETKVLFERQVTVACHGWHLGLEIEDIKGVAMRSFIVNKPEPQFARQTIQLKSVLKAGNERLFGGNPILSYDKDLNIVIKRDLLSPGLLARAKPFLDFLEAQPRIQPKI